MRRPTWQQRAQAIVADAEGYDEETRHTIQNALDEQSEDFAELVRRAEAGESILDVSAPLNVAAEQFKAEAIAYAQTAYNAALAHFEKYQGDPFALSRLAVVYDGFDMGTVSDAGDMHMVVTLPGYMRDRAVEDEDVRHWIRDAELFARTLAHPKCDEAFRKAFGVVYTEEMLDGSGVDWMTPEVLRVMFPLVRLAGSGTNHVCDDAKAREILVLLQSELVNEETQREVRRPLGLQ